MNRLNWAGNYEYRCEEIVEPESIEQAQEVVASAQKVHPLGSRHSFNSVADGPGVLLSTKRLNRIVEIDATAQTVTLEGGGVYGPLSEELDRNGFGLANLASLPHISVAGACATATHGSGVANPCLSAAVSRIEFIRPDGSLREVSRESDFHNFSGAVVHLGLLGPVARMTLDLVPSFQVAQTVYDDLPLDNLLSHLDEILSAGYSVSAFTEWNSDRMKQVWVKRLVSESENPPSPSEFFGAKLADGPRHMIAGMPAENCTEQMGQPGPWHHRLPHFKMEFTPSGGAEVQTEYFVARSQGGEAIQAIQALGSEISPHLYVTEIRTLASDNLWLSGAYERDTLAIHFTWRQHYDAIESLLPRIEEALAPFGARPHWGKQFAMKGARIGSLYPRLEDFKSLVREFDPQGKFQNEFAETLLFDE